LDLLMISVFISYARADDEPFVKRLYDDLSANGFGVWWDRSAMESRGRSFLQELRDAIEQVDRVLAVIGPAAVKSDYVRAEWEHARIFAKSLIPVLRLGTYALVPEHFSHLHGPDFRDDAHYADALRELERLLAAPVPPLAPMLSTIPALPPHFVPRLDDLSRLHSAVLADIERPVVVAPPQQVTAVVAMGGAGKSVLASAFARSTETRRAFGDGVLWLTAGEQPDLLAMLRLLGLAFQDDLKAYVDPQSALVRLPHVLADRVCLVVLDDVWQVDSAAPLINILTPRCRLLLTTRDAGIVSALGAQEIRLEMLTDSDAMKLLAEWAAEPVESLPPLAREIVEECENLPFALALCGALVHDNGVPWSDLLNALRDADLAFIEKALPNYPYRDVLRSLRVSVDALERDDARAAKCYLDLAVFPKDEQVPEAAALTLWTARGLGDRDARKLLGMLDRKALLRLYGEAPYRRVTLHDLQADYLRAVVGDLAPLHERILQAYATRCPARWPTGPNDGYFFEHLYLHLEQAHREAELIDLLGNYDWISAKLAATGALKLTAGYEMVRDPEIETIRRALSLSSDTLGRDPGQLPNQIIGRLALAEQDRVRSILAACARTEIALRLQTATLMPPGGPLLRSVTGGRGLFSAMAVSADGTRAVTSSWDGGVQAWSVDGGYEIHSFVDPSFHPLSVALTPDGSRMAATCSDNRLRVWDMKTWKIVTAVLCEHRLGHSIAISPNGSTILAGAQSLDYKASYLWVVDITDSSFPRTRSVPTPHPSDIDIAPDGSRAASVSIENILTIWDLKTDEKIGEFESSQQLQAVKFSPNGSRVLFGGSSGLLEYFQVDGGDYRSIQLRGNGLIPPIHSIAVAPDGQSCLCTASDIRTVRVCRLDEGRECEPLAGHFNEVVASAFLEGGKQALSAGADGTLKTWDLGGSKAMARAPRHTDRVTAIALDSTGSRAVSSSADCTVRVWDIPSASELHVLKGHVSAATSVVIARDGRTAASVGSWWFGPSDKEVRVWDLDSGTAKFTLEGHAYGVNAVALTPDEHWLLTGSSDATVRIWDLGSGRARAAIPVSGSVTAILVSNDGSTAFVMAQQRGVSALVRLGIPDGRGMTTIREWHSAEGFTREVMDYMVPGTAMAFTADHQQLLVSGEQYAIDVLDLRGATVVGELRGHKDMITAISVLPDGQRAVSASVDGTVRLWSLAELGELCVLQGHLGGVWAVSSVPGGRHVTSAGNDGYLIVWDTESRRAVAQFIADAAIRDCAVAPDGRTIVAGDALGNVHFLRVNRLA
jgi:WD40 repeat protein